MDPITAVGLGSAIVTFIQIGTKIAKRIKGLSEVGDIPEIFRDIRTRLPLLISIVVRTQDGINNLSPKAKEAFEEVIRQSFEQIRQLDDVLQKVTISKGDSRLKRTVRAGISLVEEGRIQKIAIVLKDNVQLLTFLTVNPGKQERQIAEELPLEPPPSYASENGVFLIPFNRDEKFVGRESILRSIGSSFRTQKRVAISGIGGVG